MVELAATLFVIIVLGYAAVWIFCLLGMAFLGIIESIPERHGPLRRSPTLAEQQEREFLMQLWRSHQPLPREGDLGRRIV